MNEKIAFLATLTLLTTTPLLAISCSSRPAESAPASPAATATPGEQPPSESSEGGDKSAPGSVLTEETGSVVRVGEEWFGLVPDYDRGTRFAPDDLPEEFREDGLRVIFTGTVGEIPPYARGGRLWGTPFELREIRRLEE